MAELAFLDTNVLLRHLLQDHPTHSPAATRLMDQLESGSAKVLIVDSVIFETVCSLEKTYRIARPEIASGLLPIVELPAIELPGKSVYRQVFSYWVQHKGLSFADCFHAVNAERFTNGVIISFDRGFDRLPDIQRREPVLDQS
jgi:predicted nucleic acid-binding protein